jgi:catechol 2,3-dioxygenase-like lactoylglutathione lyase family enzyme
MLRILLVALLAFPLLSQTAAPNKAGVSMGHLHLLSRDPSLHRTFWVDFLGGQPVTLGQMEFFKFPGALVMIRKGEPSAGSDGSSVNHLGFLVGNLEEYVKKAQAKGFEVAPERPSPTQAFVFAPDGVKVELTEDKSVKGGAVHHHVHFFTPSDTETKAWYVRMFDSVPGRRGRFEAADVPGANLTFSKSAQPTAPTKGRGMDHIGFEVKGLEQFVKKMQAEGIVFDVPYRQLPAGLAIAFFTDPWGTYVELTEGLNKL